MAVVPGRRAETRRWLSGAVVGAGGLAVVAYLVAVVVGWVDPANRLSGAELTLVGVLLAGAALPLVRGLPGLKELALGPKGLTIKVRRLENQQDELAGRVRAVQLALGSIVTRFEQSLLEGLAGDGPFLVRYRSALLDDLRRLRALGFVSSVPGGFRAISDEYKSQRDVEFDLRDYARVEPQGLEYLQVRAEVLGGGVVDVRRASTDASAPPRS